MDQLSDEAKQVFSEMPEEEKLAFNQRTEAFMNQTGLQHLSKSAQSKLAASLMGIHLSIMVVEEKARRSNQKRQKKRIPKSSEVARKKAKK